MMTKNPYLRFILLALVALIWGTSFILIKQGLKTLPAEVVASLRITAASLFALPIALTNLRELKSGDLPKLLLSGCLAMLVPAFLFSIAQTGINSSLTGILNSLSPVFTMLMGALLFQQRFSSRAVIGVIISFIGCFLLALSRSGGQITGFNFYALLVVLACALYGINLNFVKYKVEGLNAMSITSISLLMIGPIAGLYLFGFTDFVSIVQTVPGAWQSVGYIVLLGLFGTVVAHLLFYKLVHISTPLFASTVTYLMPIVAVGWGLIDNEKLLPGHIVGMGAILLGVYLANRK